jgi:hypothetical protein
VERKKSLEIFKGRLENTIKMDVKDINGHNQYV